MGGCGGEVEAEKEGGVSCLSNHRLPSECYSHCQLSANE